jgi:hypothetical protein
VSSNNGGFDSISYSVFVLFSHTKHNGDGWVTWNFVWTFSKKSLYSESFTISILCGQSDSIMLIILSYNTI